MNIMQIFQRFPDQEACIEHLEKVRWKDIPKCPYCGSENTNPLKKEQRHHCNGCRKSFSVTVGTIFHHTHLPLQKWFLAISLILNAKKGIASRQLARDLELPVKTAWFLNMRIRRAMKADNRLLKGIVEMDETYIGGKPRKSNRHDDKHDDPPTGKTGRGTEKPAVVGIIERGGEVRLSAHDKGELKAMNLTGLVRRHVDTSSSIVITDEYKGYIPLKKFTTHLVITHNRRYVEGNIYTNTIESFFALLKRGIIGQYHKVSRKYLGEYINEFSYRFNARFLSGEDQFNRTVERLLCLT